MTTERLTDSLGRTWTPGPVIGRGTWGRSRSIRDAAGREAVLKEPLAAGDFPADAPLPEDLVARCRACAGEQVQVLHEGALPFLPKLEATVELGSGRVGLVFPRYATTLQRRLEAGLPLGDALRIVQRIAQALADAGAVHGNLRPTNVLFGERGEAYLSDVSTPALAAHRVLLLDEADARGWAPPELRDGRSRATEDTWALCQVLYACATHAATPDGGRPARPELSDAGLDKLTVATLKDRALARLATEGSNPRFRSRVSDRLGALLARGLSAETEPSPPFRFSTCRDLADRVSEVLALVRPKVVDVGKLLMPGTSTDGVFQGGQEVAFTVTVGCTPGISDHDDLVCGLQLVDLDAPEGGRRPIDDATFAVQVHPSGRLRFQLGLTQVPPGRYRLRVAFAIKDSGDEPHMVNGDFEVRPPPGYVPPRAEAPPSALRFPGGAPGITPRPAEPAGRYRDEERLTDPGEDDEHGFDRDPPSAADPPSGPGGELIAGVFPRPVAPPEEDDDDDDDEPPPAPVPVARPRPVAAVVERASLEDFTDSDLLPIGERPTEPTDDPLPPPARPAAHPSAPPPPPALRALPTPPGDDHEPLDTEELLEDTDDVLGLGRMPAFAQDPDLPPEATTDLPSWSDADRSRLPEPILKLVEFVKRDQYVALGVAVAGSLLLLLILTALARSC